MKKKQSVTFLLCEKKIYRLEGVAMAVAGYNSSCDAVLYIIPAVLDQMTTFPRNDSPIRSLRGTHRRLSLHLSAQHTHTSALVIFIDAQFINVIFFHSPFRRVRHSVDIPSEQIENYF